LTWNSTNGLGMFPFRVDIKEINLWSERVPIGEVIDKLDFIKDKKNYGLYLRLSNKIIDKIDFIKIVSTSR